MAPARTTRKQQEEVRDLEELLKSGDIDGYAQACWNLANSTEETAEGWRHHNLIRSMRGAWVPRIQVQAHPAVNDDHHPVPRKRPTCGEEIRAVARKLTPEELPCYWDGHRETSLETR